MPSKTYSYPYDYVDDPSKFADTQFPAKEDFYSQLQEGGISDEDYAHAQNVWDVFQCTNFGECHNIYLKSDVLALVDVFEIFRNLCLTTYGLDPAHYYTAPGLLWDAMLKLVNEGNSEEERVHLKLINDIDMYQMEKGIRGGISVISQKYAQANNSYVEGYDATKPSNYLMYIECQQPLRLGCLKVCQNVDSPGWMNQNLWIHESQ